ncbi:Uncharacterized protein OBRU01_20273, partial [Operophtera brumata]
MPQSEFWPFISHKTVESEDVGLGGQALLLVPEPDTAVKDIHTLDNNVHRLHEDKYCHKDNEVSRLRDELIRAKNTADEERLQRFKYEAKLKDFELKINDICCAGKTYDSTEYQKVSNEVVALKTQLRDMKEDAEEMRITVDEKSEQLQEYRVKYLQAQQQVEELKRTLDVMEFDKKLLELAPLPDLLKAAQMQLHEAKQLQKLGEDSAHQISNELHRVKEKVYS